LATNNDINHLTCALPANGFYIVCNLCHEKEVQIQHNFFSDSTENVTTIHFEVLNSCLSIDI